MHGEHGVLVQDGGSHVAQLPQLLVGDGGNLPGIFHNAGVGHEEAGHIRPVFIHVRARSPGHDGAGDVAAAAAEGMHLAVGLGAIEAGHYGGLAVRKGGGHQGLGGLAVEIALFVKAHGLRRVQEPPAQIVRQEHAVEILAPAGAVVGAFAPANARAYLVQGRGDVRLQVQRMGNVHIPGADFIKGCAIVLACGGLPVAQVEQIRHLVVLREASAGGRGHHILPGRLHVQDALHLGKLACVRKRAAAKLRYDLLQACPSSIPFIPKTIPAFIIPPSGVSVNGGGQKSYGVS